MYHIISDIISQEDRNMEGPIMLAVQRNLISYYFLYVYKYLHKSFPFMVNSIKPS